MIMLKNPIPEPMVQLLGFTVRLVRFVVIGAWGYLALALIALQLTQLPRYAGPAGSGLMEAFENSGSAFVGAVMALTIVHWIAAQLLQGERTRQDAIETRKRS